jgi:hypothetical protein
MICAVSHGQRQIKIGGSRSLAKRSGEKSLKEEESASFAKPNPPNFRGLLALGPST